MGDGTTSVVVVAGELLEASKQFIEANVHPHLIARAVRGAPRRARGRP